MKSLQSLRIARRILTSSSLLSSTSFPRLISTSPLSDTDDPTTSDFDSRHLSLPLSQTPAATKPIWNTKFRSKADRVLGVRQNAKVKKEIEEREVEKERMLARALLEAALLPPDEDEDEDEGEGVREEEQKSLSVGIVGAPNAGKSCLTNVMVGTKVAAVSRKTNTTTHEVLGVMTKENTQISFFDTPGITVHRSGHPYKTDFRFRVESAFNTIDLYDLLIVLFDVDRHLTKPDKRVIRLIKQLGEKVQPGQKRILCLNKIDLVKNRKDLLNVAKEFEDLPGYERHFMISGLKGSGVKDLLQYLMDQAVERPWDEELNVMSEEMMKNIALEVVREKLLDHIHQEIPYVIDHRLMDWKELRDGSLRVEQHFITLKDSQRQILVGKNGSKIGRIGIEANEELRSIFKREVHLILQVRVARRKNA